ncbi:MAG TPA: transposase [Solirubrobacter sp.]|nr:transposase [Solirubrobacter sp.]
MNTTDPNSRKVIRAGKAPVQGYNAQAVATAGQIILAADLTQQGNDSGQLEPMIGAALDQLSRAGVPERLQTVLADGGYWNSDQIAALGEQHLQVIVPTRSAVRTSTRTLSPRQGPEAERIDALLATRTGAALYRQRQHIIETVFARTTFARAITRF